MPEKQIVAIDGSTLDAWDQCHKYYELVHIKHLTTANKPTSLDQGQLLHLMLKNYYTMKKDESNFNFTHALESSVAIGYNTECDLSPSEMEEVISNFRGYCTKYQNENWRILEVEKPFALTLYDTDSLQIIGQGICDLIVDTPTGLAIVDHKKRSQRREENSFTHQRMMYTWALKIPTFITNKTVFIKDPDKYMRQIDQFEQEQHEEWLKELVMEVKEILAFKSINFYRRNPTSCDKYGGCIFKKYCNVSASRRELQIGSKFFTGDTWDVGVALEK